MDIFRSVSKLRFRRAYEAFSNNQIQQTQLIIDDMNLLSNFKLNKTPVVFSPRSHPAKAYATTRSGLLSWVSLVLLFQDFEEVLGHHVGPLRAAVIPLQILHWKEVKEKDIKPCFRGLGISLNEHQILQCILTGRKSEWKPFSSAKTNKQTKKKKHPVFFFIKQISLVKLCLLNQLHCKTHSH